MHEDPFPKKIMAQILSKKNRFNLLPGECSLAGGDGGGENTPQETERENKSLLEAAYAANAAMEASGMPDIDDEQDANFGEKTF